MNRRTWLTVAMLLSIAAVEFGVLATGIGVPHRAGAAPARPPFAGLTDVRDKLATGAPMNVGSAVATSTPTPQPATTIPTPPHPQLPVTPLPGAPDVASIDAGSISGIVTNALGTPIAGAQVDANLDTCCGSGYTVSAADGMYVITGLVPGSYRVQASASGYAPTYYNGTYDYSAATLVAAGSGVTTPNINFALVLGGRISGTVTNALGTPIAGASISASRDPCCGSGYTVSAADGMYIITGLVPGSYRVQASASGYAPTYYNGMYDYSAATLVATTSGVTTPNINVALAVGGGISGTVTNALGTPIAGANISVNRDPCCGWGNATSATDGTYTISGLPPGSYRVQASGSYCPAGATSPPCVDYVSQYYNGADDYSAATLVATTSGVTTPNINFALVAGGHITGTVTNTLGTPIAGANISANRDPCCSGGSATSAADGTYAIVGLSPGSYRVQASGPYCPAGATSPPCVGYASQYYNGTYDYNAAALVATTSGVTRPTSTSHSRWVAAFPAR